jgi:hypothetical protein
MEDDEFRHAVLASLARIAESLEAIQVGTSQIGDIQSDLAWVEMHVREMHEESQARDCGDE